MLWPEKGARRTVGRRAQLFRQRWPRVTGGKRTGPGRLRRSMPKHDKCQRRYPIPVWVTVGWAWASYPHSPIVFQSARGALLSVIVTVGDSVRLFGILVDGWPAPTMALAATVTSQVNRLDLTPIFHPGRVTVLWVETLSAGC